MTLPDPQHISRWAWARHLLYHFLQFPKWRMEKIPFSHHTKALRWPVNSFIKTRCKTLQGNGHTNKYLGHARSASDVTHATASHVCTRLPLHPRCRALWRVNPTMLSSPKGCPNMLSRYLLPGEAQYTAAQLCSAQCRTIQTCPSLCKLTTLRESMHIVRLDVHKPPPGPSLYTAKETRPGGAWKCWAGLDGTGHQLGSTFCLYISTLTLKGWVS